MSKKNIAAEQAKLEKIARRDKRESKAFLAQNRRTDKAIRDTKWWKR